MKKLIVITLTVFLISSCRQNDDLANNILKFYGDALENIGYSIADAGDGIVMGGQITDVVRTNPDSINERRSKAKMALVKTDYDGNVIWQKLYGDTRPSVGKKALTLDDGSIICIGYVVDTAASLQNIYIVKVDSRGELLKQFEYKPAGDNANQYAIDIISTGGGFLVLAATDAFRAPDAESAGNEAGKKDILMLKINDNLELESTPLAFGFPGNDEGVSIKQDYNGGYVVVATTDRSEPGTQQGSNNILIMNVNLYGKVIKNKIIGSDRPERAIDIDVQSDGYLVVATIENDAQTQYGYVWKLSSDIFAAPVYEHRIDLQLSGASTSFSVNAITRYKSTSYVMAGQSGTGSSARMVVFLTDSEGNLQADNVVFSGGTGSQAINDVVVDTNGNIYSTGSNKYESSTMMALLKFRF